MEEVTAAAEGQHVAVLPPGFAFPDPLVDVYVLFVGLRIAIANLDSFLPSSTVLFSQRCCEEERWLRRMAGLGGRVELAKSVLPLRGGAVLILLVAGHHIILPSSLLPAAFHLQPWLPCRSFFSPAAAS